MTAASESSPTFGILIHFAPCSSVAVLPPGQLVCRIIMFFHPSFAADSGVSAAMQLEEFSNQQNGNYQPHLEPISAVRLIYSPPALVEPQFSQGLNQQLPAPAPDGNYIQASTQSEDAVHQQTAARLHPGTYQQADGQPYQLLTVSLIILLLGFYKFSILLFCFLKK